MPIPTDSLLLLSASPPEVFLAGLGRPLLVLHAIAALVLCGASVHQAVYGLRLLRRKPSARLLYLARLFSRISLAAYVATMGLGALIYPRYRVWVRGLYLDREAPWASNLFDFKENLATIGLPFALSAVILAAQLGRGPTTRAQDPLTETAPLPRKLIRLYVVFALGTAAVAVWNALSGLLVTSVHGI
jgi:uncharacterized membrane protein